VNTFVDTLMVIRFVLFMVYIFRGYHLQRLAQVEEEEKEAAKGSESKTEASSDENAPER
jgi:hypothetical protein